MSGKLFNVFRQNRMVIAGSALAIAVGLFSSGDASAQMEQFSGETTNAIGSHFTLVIRKTANKLTFDLAAESAQTSLNGIPNCQSADLKADGTFLTYCSGFGNGLGGSSFRFQLSGTLSVAKLENVGRFGTAEFRLTPGPIKR
jgi:hypothetical protein